LSRVIVAYDGTKYCFYEINDEGKAVRKECCKEAVHVKLSAPCELEGYSDAPGFVARCEGRAECKGSSLVVLGA